MSSTQTVHATSPSLARADSDIFRTSAEEFKAEALSLELVIANLDKVATYNQGQGATRYRPERNWDVKLVRETVAQYEYHLKLFNAAKQDSSENYENNEAALKMRKLFLSPETTQNAFRALLRCKINTADLAQKVRDWERYLGNLGETPLTDGLSLVMVKANGKAGNVGRTLSLLALRKSRNFEPRASEFIHAITAIEAAGLHLRIDRNTFLSEKDQPQIDDPTRWLDAILLNMSQRGFPLTTAFACKMLNTYTTTGKSGKAFHYFYKVHRKQVDGDEEDYDDNLGIARFQRRPVKVRLSMRPPPPYQKIPSQVRGKLVRKPGTDIKQLKLDRESDPDWSPALTSAIAFADSLKQGACGHGPIELDCVVYSILVKACVYRGSLWRAMHIIDEVMPANGIEPDVVTYNTLLSGLARVGDVPTIREYFSKMLANQIGPEKETVKAVVDGLLNLGDVQAAITVVQDCFNQHSVLPPYTTHLKILEFALGRGLVYEAKRHVYFIQQLWKWKRNGYHSEEFSKIVELTQKNPKLSKEALQKLFAYFGETLEESDFI